MAIQVYRDKIKLAGIFGDQIPAVFDLLRYISL